MNETMIFEIELYIKLSFHECIYAYLLISSKSGNFNYLSKLRNCCFFC